VPAPVERREGEQRRGDRDVDEAAQHLPVAHDLPPFCSCFGRGIETSDQPNAKTSTIRRRSQPAQELVQTADPSNQGKSATQRTSSTTSGRSRTQPQTPPIRSARRS